MALEYHGQSSLIYESSALRTDPYGLSTATCVWKTPKSNFHLAPALDSAHPVWGFLYMERREVALEPGFAVITGEYTGLEGGASRSVYELSFGLSDEPIQTHPDFLSDIGGKPSAILNGAYFVDPETGAKSTDDNVGVFDHFLGTIDGARNLFAGIESYLSPQVTLREIWTGTTPVVASGLGKINTPSGGATPPIAGNWLLIGASFQQRGRVYSNTREWRGSGRNQWNPTIYGS